MELDVVRFSIDHIDNQKTEKEQAIQCKSALFTCLKYLYQVKNTDVPEKASLLELIDSSAVNSVISDQTIIDSLHFVRILGTNAEHDLKIRKTDVQVAKKNVQFFFDILKNVGNNLQINTPDYMSEYMTRVVYIDTYLSEAGWEILTVKNEKLPAKAGIEIEVTGMPNAHEVGYCDYVLYGKNNKPLAIVEAKKTSVSPEKGRQQVILYGECMQKEYGYTPVLYYTNGYDIRIIDGLYPDRKIHAFHTIDELELMLQRQHRGDITDITISDAITNRPYQKIAINKVCERFNQKHRKALLVMATGTGKTRVSISLVDILLRNKWVKNVLFLADRVTLVSQAKKNFEKLLPDMTICVLSDKDKNRDTNARLMFSTYQTMINYIDGKSKEFSSGRFDLIIIDEAHRSVFNKYAAIFEYFDSLLVGLTATPKDQVDANTYSLFECESGEPNFDYSLEEAVKDHYLVPYKILNRSTKLMQEGIKYDDLSEEDRITIEGLYDDPTIPNGELFRHIYNKDTCRRVIEELMLKGIHCDNGQLIGKTIIFAYNHEHAQMIVECFKKMYPDLGDTYCQLIDNYVNYAESLVDRFEENHSFRIAVSVDMLDTGVDIPEVANLVFFKPVKSKIKFVQMIGRGTRLCPNLFGPGEDKKEFYIFDYCNNFDYFNVHGDEPTKIQQKSISQKLFEIKADLVFELQSSEYQDNAFAKTYYAQLKNDLKSTLSQIKSHDERILVRSEMKYVDKYCTVGCFDGLTEINIAELRSHITRLVDPIDDDYVALSFDLKMMDIELAKLVDGNVKSVVPQIRTIKATASYLLRYKASIPDVANHLVELNTLLDDHLWNSESKNIEDLEMLRTSVRDLMKYLDGDEKKVIIDATDTIITLDGIDNTDIDIRTYRERVMDYLAQNQDVVAAKKILNLDTLDKNDWNELEEILWHKLGNKEDYQRETDTDNIAVFVRSLIGLDQNAINEKFGKYLDGHLLNSQQQEFIKSIIDYTKQNGDIRMEDLVEVEPFENYSVVDVFGEQIPALKDVVNTIHNCVTYS